MDKAVELYDIIMQGEESELTINNEELKRVIQSLCQFSIRMVFKQEPIVMNQAEFPEQVITMMESSFSKFYD
jgi:hypothetical protein